MVDYPEEVLDEDEDDGTMVQSRDALRDAIVGRRIVSVKQTTVKDHWGYKMSAHVITLDDGRRVEMVGDGDCCAYTEINNFLLNPQLVDHAITGVGTTDGYTTWHVFCDLGDILSLDVSWSCGNPFYYGYGFDIVVKDLDE